MSITRCGRRGEWRATATGFLQAVINGAFPVPGDPRIDFDGLLRLLHRHGYADWLVVEAEQDPAVAPSYQYADMGYRHLAGLVQAIGNEQEAA